MHENHAVQNLVNQAIEKAQERKAKKVTKVIFGLGDLVGFDDGAINLYYDDMTAGTILEGAKLVVNHYIPKLKCKDCSKIFEDSRHEFKCPFCSSMALTLASGKEFFLESIETE